MADHNVTVELFYSGAWNKVPAYTRDGITLSRGAPGEGQEAPPSAAGLTLDNRTGDYNPKNPTSALYGLAGRNTPMRVSADGSVRSTTEAASWAPQRAIKGDAWTPVQGGGILRRLQQGKTPLKPPLERAILAADPVAYWPLNEGKDATQFSSGLAAGTALDFRSEIATGEITGGNGTGGAFPNLADTPAVLSYAEGTFNPAFAGADWAMTCMVYIGPTTDGDGSGDNPVLAWSTTDYLWGVLTGWDPTDGAYVSVFGRIGGSNADVGRFAGIPNGWSHVRLLVYQSGADARVELYVNGTSVDSYGVGSRTVVGVTVGPPTGYVLVGSKSEQAYTNDSTGEYTTEAASLGMVAFHDTLADQYDASTGYVGELAGERFLRVLGEEGITAVVVGDELDTQPMGPQPVDTLVNIARECVRTDDGMMFEPRDQIALAMRTGRDRYNQTSALNLNFAAAGIGVPLAPVQDDQNTRNDVKAVRRNGSSAQATKLTGPLNVSDPIDDPDGIGRYDTQVDVNPASDDVLISHATWHMHKGTVDEPRYPQVVVDLDAAPTLISAVNALDIGDRVTIANLPTDWHQGDPASLLVLGIKETYPGGAGDYRRLVALNTVPASTFEIGIVGLDDGSVDLRGAAVDTDLSTLASGINSTTTTLSVASTGGVLWTTDADDWNPALHGGGLYLLVGGEEMRVTNISGASSPQTFTVVRSTNGVVKTHASGTSVVDRNPIRVAL